MAGEEIKLLVLIASSLLLFTIVDATGLSLKLVPLHSLNSSSHITPNGNVTDDQHDRRRLDSINANVVGYKYVVQVKIGSRLMAQNLLFSTGSSLTWIQCEGCNPRFPQNRPLYSPRYSTTESSVPCNDPIRSESRLFGCLNNRLTYSLSFGRDESQLTTIRGVFIRELFRFQLDDGQQSNLQGIAFGCNVESHTQLPLRDAEIDGELGLGRERMSFISQTTEIYNGRFSYCLGDFGAGTLRLGSDARRRERRFVTTPYLPARPNEDFYFLNLIDLSINDERLNIVRGSFEVRKNGRGGMFITSSTGFSTLQIDVYNRVLGAIGLIMRRNRARRLRPANIRGNEFQCWRPEEGSSSSQLPSLTFHFQGGDLKVKGKYLFMKVDDLPGSYCLGLKSDEVYTILGMMQQRGHRFLFDNVRQRLQFSESECID